MTFLLLPQMLPFTAALLLLLVLAGLQLIGLEAEFDGGDAGLGAALDWLKSRLGDRWPSFLAFATRAGCS